MSPRHPGFLFCTKIFDMRVIWVSIMAVRRITHAKCPVELWASGLRSHLSRLVRFEPSKYSQYAHAFASDRCEASACASLEPKGCGVTLRCSAREEQFFDRTTASAGVACVFCRVKGYNGGVETGRRETGITRVAGRDHDDHAAVRGRPRF